VLFSLITLPVEFNASRRAMAALEGRGYLSWEELDGAKKVLNAAALTYVAAALSAILNLLRLLVLARRSDRD
jgi:Zn-dependent membrane protease YugP